MTKIARSLSSLNLSYKISNAYSNGQSDINKTLTNIIRNKVIVIRSDVLLNEYKFFDLYIS